jgi:hypothetical protein
MFKKYLISLSLLFLTVNITYADCEYNNIDKNNKYQVTMKMIDILEIIDSNESRFDNSLKNNNEVDRIYALKRENIEFQCAIDTISYFNNSEKEMIKKGTNILNKYLNKKIEWNNKFQKILNEFMNTSNLKEFDNNLADLKIEQDNLQNLLRDGVLSLMFLLRFEQSDDYSVDMNKFGVNVSSFIWITNEERNNIIENFISKTRKISNNTILIGVKLWSDLQLSFKNNNVHSKEDILKNYKSKL